METVNKPYVSDWIDEEKFFELYRSEARHGRKIKIVDRMWSKGSSPIMLYKWSYVE